MKTIKEIVARATGDVVVVRGFKNGVISIVAIVIIGCLMSISATNKEAGTSDSVLTSKTKVTSYVENLYTSKSNVTVTAGTETKLKSNNYSQSNMRVYYNNNNGSATDIGVEDGICWASAITSLLKYNGVSGTANEIGYNVLTVAKSDKYWTSESTGVYMSDIDNLVTKMFTTYDISKKGNNDYYNIYSTLKDEIKDKRVVLFSIKEHIMTGCGYVTYYVTYSQKNILNKTVTKSASQDFVIVNDTWANNSIRQYSYFPKREIGTNVANRWEFGICKVKDK